MQMKLESLCYVCTNSIPITGVPVDSSRPTGAGGHLQHPFISAAGEAPVAFWIIPWDVVSNRDVYTASRLLLLTFKSLNGLAPSYLSGLLQPYVPGRALRSADQHLLTVPKTRYVTVGDRSFAKAAPTLWNALPLTVRSCKSLNSFKRKLKTYLFKCAYQ